MFKRMALFVLAVGCVQTMTASRAFAGTEHSSCASASGLDQMWISDSGTLQGSTNPVPQITLMLSGDTPDSLVKSKDYVDQTDVQITNPQAGLIQVVTNDAAKSEVLTLTKSAAKSGSGFTYSVQITGLDPRTNQPFAAPLNMDCMSAGE